VGASRVSWVDVGQDRRSCNCGFLNNGGSDLVSWLAHSTDGLFPSPIFSGVDGWGGVGLNDGTV